MGENRNFREQVRGSDDDGARRNRRSKHDLRFGLAELLELPDEATTMLLNTKGTHGDISKDIKSFYNYVNNHIVTTDFTKQIDDEISYLKLDTKVRREFMLMEARLLDERREGKAEGIAEGKEIGLAEGKEIGLAEEKLATAKRMLAKGCYSLDDIAELTNLSLADVEKLKEEA